MGRYPKPRRRNFTNSNDYMEAFNEWRRATNNWNAQPESEEQARRSGGWQSGGSVGNQSAKTRQRGNRTEALYGGKDKPDGKGHGHVASNDGVNANYLRDPGMAPNDYVVNDDERNIDPYDSSKGKR